MSQIKYAVVDQLIEKSHHWAAQPWIKYGAEKFSSIHHVPSNYVLLAIHFAPWWSPLKEWIEAGNKWIEIDYGYWGHNLPRRNTRRVTYCGSHNLKMKTPPFSRIKNIDPPVLDWKQKRGNYILVIEPQQDMIFQRTNITLRDWKLNLHNQIRNFWSGEIVWRKKRGSKDPIRWPEYVSQLENCFGVVGERTMACVEAAIMGYQAYTTDFSLVSLLMGDKLENILEIQHPDRSAWLNHIAWSQFTREEFYQDQEVAILTERYQIL